MIELRLWKRSPAEPDLICPVVICDHCGHQITHLEPGNVLWDSDMAAESALFYVHKKCDRAFGKPFHLSRELHEFIGQLSNNYRNNPL